MSNVVPVLLLIALVVETAWLLRPDRPEPALEPQEGLESRVRRRALVTLKSGDAFAGIVFEADRLAIVLREAQQVGVGDRNESHVVDGEVLLLLADVAYVQYP